MTKLAILRVGRDHIQMLSTSVTFITNINSKKLKVRQLFCSGTIKKIEL